MIDTVPKVKVLIRTVYNIQNIAVRTRVIKLTEDEWKVLGDVKVFFKIFVKPTKMLPSEQYLSYALSSHTTVFEKCNKARGQMELRP